MKYKIFVTAFLIILILTNIVYANTDLGQNIAYQKQTLTSSAMAIDFDGDKTVDGKDSTRWYVPQTKGEQWLNINFMDSYFVNKIVIIKNIDNDINYKINGKFRNKICDITPVNIEILPMEGYLEKVIITFERNYVDEIKLTFSTKSPLSVYEVEMYNNIAEGELPSEIPKMKLDANVTGDGVSPSNLLDFDKATIWEIKSSVGSVQFDLGQVKLLNYFLLCEDQANIKSGFIEGSIDGIYWNKIVDFNDINMDNRLYVEDFNARYIKLHITSATEDSKLNSFEWDYIENGGYSQ